ncbi:hypothetical protein CCHL11_08773 [Colletotrichum chlorophyti]|uniref:Uncharacterized protein n=1 Tax=Colletotrichum chlorophyti TaxID=708187 RepID=A0A1Q8REE9_9PEZI|nr:hypothetical protein CCHL11_08773 [Colletotrichum chlorophyti]
MGPSTSGSSQGPALAPLAQAQSYLNRFPIDDQGHFLDNDFVCELHRQLSILGWKNLIRCGTRQQTNIGQLQELRFFVTLPIGHQARFHTSLRSIYDRLNEIFASPKPAALT